MKIEEFKYFKSDVPAGMVVFLVAIPLCLGIALASGAPPLAGIIAGIVGGIVVTVFSNSSMGVSGPAAGLVAIVLDAIAGFGGLDNGGFEIFLLAVFVSGIMQFVLGCVRAGAIGHYFPMSVVKGMLAAIGLIIILKQIPHALGYDKDYEGDLAFFQEDGFNTFSEIGHALNAFTPGSIVISAVCMLILIVWERPAIKNLKISTIVQGPLVAVVAGIVMQWVFKNSTTLQLSADHLVNLPTTSLLNEFKHPDWSMVYDKRVYTTAVTLAVIASLESLLCAEATDKLDPKRRQTNLNRELRAQGIGNMVSGLIGGLPVTQVIVRSSTNIQSGAQTRVSALVHGILLLVCVASIPGVLNMIPLASLAAILLVVGFKLAHPSKFKSMYQLGWAQFMPFLITIGAILLTDLLRGIGIGLAASIFFILRSNFVKAFWLDSKQEGDRMVHRMTLAERIYFMNKGQILTALKSIESDSKLIVDGSNTLYLDQDVLDVFDDYKTTAPHQNIELEMIDVTGDHAAFEPARIRERATEDGQP